MLNNSKELNLDQLPYPETVNWQDSARNSYGMLPDFMRFASKANNFQQSEALKGYSRFQPYYQQNQELIGRNVASYARGELPADVVSSIGRAAAQRGFSGGFAYGASGGGPGTSLGALNLRNIGLTSLGLSQQGTSLAMQANESAARMTPALIDPNQWMMNPYQTYSAEMGNANILNDWNRANVGIRNAEISGNTELANSILNEQAKARAQEAANYGAALQSASNTAAGLYMQNRANSGGGYGAGFQQNYAGVPNAGAVQGYNYSPTQGYILA